MARYWIDTTRSALAAYGRHGELYRGADVAYPYTASTDASQRILVLARFCDFGACCLSGSNAADDKATLETAGFTTVTESELAIIVAEWFPLRAPEITTHPIGGTYSDDATFSLSVVALRAVRYQWQFSEDSAVWSDIEGATSETYSGTAGEDTYGFYRVVVSNQIGNVTSNSAVAIRDTYLTAPTITINPTGGEYYNGDIVTIFVDTSGSMPQTFQWYNSSGPISGATSKTYSFTFSKSLSDNYYCIATNPYGYATSENATVSGSTILLIQVDSSGNIIERTGNGTVTINGTVIVDHTTTHDGYGSIRNTASGTTTGAGYVDVGCSLDITGDFTIEGRCLTLSSSYYVMLGLELEDIVFDASIDANITDGTTGLNTYYSSFGSLFGLITIRKNWDSISTPINTWYHTAIVRKDGVISFFVDGNEISGSISDTKAFTIKKVYIPHEFIAYAPACCWENIRISDVARYTENFTPPGRF